MGRWSALVGREFLGWHDTGPGCAWLDVGCGTGSLSRLILEMRAPAKITGVDSSPALIAHAKKTITDGRAQFREGQAQALDLPSNVFDAVVSGLMLNFVPQQKAAILEMRRTAKPGGEIGIFVWDYAEGMQMLRYFWDAVIELDPASEALDEGPRFPICREGALEVLARESGLRHVKGRAIEVETRFQDFNDYWEPFLGNVGPAPAYIQSLDKDRRQQMRERLKSMLPVARDGSIRLKARAWAVKCRV
jgi:SAM-dependent methyltransferase